MSYHEYANQDGKLRRQHDNGHHVTNAREAINTVEQIYQNADPESKLWERQASFTLEVLGKLLGGGRYVAWYELVWPGDKIDNYTWKQICEMAESAYYKALLGERDIKELATRSKIAHSGLSR